MILHRVDEDATMTRKDVITNDTDQDGDNLSLISITNPQNGIAVINIDNKSIDYTPNANFNGEEIIIYNVSDGFKSDVGALIVKVNSVNDAPIAIDDNTNLIEDSVSTKIDVISNDKQ